MQGHLIDKLDIIIEGGTYTEYPKSYLLRFHRDIFYTANTFFHSHPKREPYALDAEMKINTKTKIKTGKNEPTCSTALVPKLFGTFLFLK